MTEVSTGLAAVRHRVEAAAERAGRHSQAITLVAVSKGQPPASVKAAYDDGQRDFGESRAQELLGKAPQLPDDIRWHFVGSLQRNKAAKLRGTVCMLHSLDSEELGVAWLKGPGKAPPALLEINLGGEEHKAGVEPAVSEETAEQLISLGVDLRGVMTVPPLGKDPRACFEDLIELSQRLQARWPQLREVSAGMSDDFEVAIEAGATMVRIGRAIFGPRKEGLRDGNLA